MAETKYQRLIRLLKEMFQLGDAAELDFGIYRIMHARKDEIEKFLNEELFQKHVKEALKSEAGGERESLETEITELEQKIKDVGGDPANNDMYQELVAKRELAPDNSALETEVYNHLLTFFGRYYEEGDFISQRRYGENTYAIPYNGEEVKLHWANHDQYYIKSSETLKHYAFRIGPDGKQKRVRFKLVSGNTEQNNVKETDDGKRFHIVKRDEDGEVNITLDGDESVIPVEYRIVSEDEIKTACEDLGIEPPKKGKQRDTLAKLNAALVLNAATLPGDFKPLFEVAHIKADGLESGKSALEYHFSKYTAKASFDYFIHKDLGGFLNREMDFFIKNELMQLEDILDGNQSPEQLGRRHFAKLRVMRNIAGKLIEFLAQLENFQKKLWLKKKFVTETNYCITLDRVPEELYEEIAANNAQREEWVKLYAIDEIKADTLGGIKYSEPLTVEFLKSNPYMMLDTEFFESTEFIKPEIEVNGQVFHSENFQALACVGRTFQHSVKCIYIDPPYNTGNDGFRYKDKFQSSSWLTFIGERLRVGKELLNKKGAQIVSIDDWEVCNLKALLTDTYGSDNFVEQIIWKRRNTPPNDKVLGAQHEYIQVFVNDHKEQALNLRERTESQLARYTNPDNHPKGPWMKGDLSANVKGGRYVASLNYPIINPITKEEYYPPNNGNWRFNSDKVVKLIESDEIWFSEDSKTQPKFKRFLCDVKEGTTYSTLWDFVPLNTSGSKEMANILGSGTIFENPKPVGLVEELLRMGSTSHSTVLDYFAGSGTTGHAVINLNREDSGDRKYVLIEMGDHFDTVLKPRLQKVVYSKGWKDGKPVGRDGVSHCFKYFRLESYEDALDNIQLKRTVEQQSEFDKLDKGEAEKYRLNYMLDVESQDSLLDIQKFERPFEYTLRITRNDETRNQNVDLVETFNWLLGLTVQTQHVSNDKSFGKDTHGIIEVTGENRDGQRVLIIWRNIDEVDDEKLIAWFKKNRYKATDFEWDLIYINGDNTIENLKRDNETWTVRLIEQEFHKLMFEGCE